MPALPIPYTQLISELWQLKGIDLINRLLEEKDPATLVRHLSSVDFFWLVKSIGIEDCLPVLEMASEEQWEYLLDLELWEKDRLNPHRTLEWLARLAKADEERLVEWLFKRGRDIFSFCLYRSAVIIVKEGETESDVPPGYESVDGIFFFKAFSEDDQGVISYLLKIAAAQDFDSYLHLMYDVAAIIPAEAEEELYRLRNVRISEHGFVPYEEALSIYAPLEPDVLSKGECPLPPGGAVNAEESLPVPAAPLMMMEKGNLLAQILSQTSDNLLRDRLGLEYAALCNKIIAAEAFEEIADREILASTWRRAGNYCHLALSSLYGKNLKAIEEAIRTHQLETIFRVGWGLVIKLRNRARKWLKSSWFHACGRESDFWGTPWGEMLTGLLAHRPMLFEGGNYRDFISPEDIEGVEIFLEKLRLLDLLLRRLHVPKLGEGPLPKNVETFHPLLFNPWARRILGHEPSISPLTRKEAVTFFLRIREKESTPPYRMAHYREVFISDFMAGTQDLSQKEQSILRETLNHIWEDFVNLYENVKEADINGRFSPYLLIERA